MARAFQTETVFFYHPLIFDAVFSSFSTVPHNENLPKFVRPKAMSSTREEGMQSKGLPFVEVRRLRLSTTLMRWCSFQKHAQNDHGAMVSGGKYVVEVIASLRLDGKQATEKRKCTLKLFVTTILINSSGHCIPPNIPTITNGLRGYMTVGVYDSLVTFARSEQARKTVT